MITIEQSINWGSVSDWCIVLVTTITAIFLYKTLKSQREVQKAQSRLLEIESVRFRESIKPSFKYSISQIMPYKKDSSLLTIEIINDSNHIAKNVLAEISAKETVKLIQIPSNIVPFRLTLNKDDTPLQLHFHIDSTEHSFFSFSFTFEDILGTKYIQNINCSRDINHSDIYSFMPVMVNSN